MQMDAAKLRCGHLPVFEAGAVERFAQTAQHQRLVELFLLGKSGDVDGLKARQRLTRVFEIVGNGLVGKIAQPIVVTVVSDLSGEFGLRAQRVLPLLGQQAIEFGAAGFEGLFGSVGEEWDDCSKVRKNITSEVRKRQTSAKSQKVRRLKISEKSRWHGPHAESEALEAWNTLPRRCANDCRIEYLLR